MNAPLPVLYVKSGCPWCIDVTAFMAKHGIAHREKNVSLDAEAMAEMRRLSGQSKAPVLDWHGTILADFGVDELIPFLRDRNVKLEDS
jgi:glutaredoxin 3